MPLGVRDAPEQWPPLTLVIKARVFTISAGLRSGRNASVDEVVDATHSLSHESDTLNEAGACHPPANNLLEAEVRLRDERAPPTGCGCRVNQRGCAKLTTAVFGDRVGPPQPAEADSPRPKSLALESALCRRCTKSRGARGFVRQPRLQAEARDESAASPKCGSGRRGPAHCRFGTTSDVSPARASLLVRRPTGYGLPTAAPSASWAEAGVPIVADREATRLAIRGSTSELRMRHVAARAQRCRHCCRSVEAAVLLAERRRDTRRALVGRLRASARDGGRRSSGVDLGRRDAAVRSGCLCLDFALPRQRPAGPA
jgi:hypothetical protein